MNKNINDIILNIKKSLRLSMNGVVSSLQRKQGLNYKINFGVEIPRIKELATQYDKSRELAVALWKENIRECKLLAIFLMPIEEFSVEDAHEWIVASEYTELADNLAMTLLHKMPNAMEHALTWIKKEETNFQYCGYMTISHLFRMGKTPTGEAEECYLNAVEHAVENCNDNSVIRICIYNSIIRYIDVAPEENIVKLNCRPGIRNFFL